jgi:radical SAM protein with 4Fe4S-binding SPASM domain
MTHPLDLVPRRPVTCIWEITRACNLRCIHCENFGGDKGESELTFDEMLTVADSLASLGCRVVDITGGEPLLHPEWDRLALALKKQGIRTALVTNGTLLDDERIDRACAAGIDIVAVSLDGPKRIHDKIRQRPTLFLRRASPFDLAFNNLRQAALKLKTKVITQVNRLNLSHLGDLRKQLGDAGIETWQLQLAVPIGRVLEYKAPFILSPADLDELTQFITAAQTDDSYPKIDTSDTIGYYTDREKPMRNRSTGQGVWLGCQAGIRVVAITYNGRVRGCSILPPEFDAGNLHEESLQSIWEKPERFAFNTAYDPTKLSGDCATCRLGPLCRAGCTAMAYHTTGTIYANPYCISRPGILASDSPPSNSTNGACAK